MKNHESQPMATSTRLEAGAACARVSHEAQTDNAAWATNLARWVLASLSLSMLLSSLGTSITHVGLPTLAQAFAASFQATQWVVLAYLLAVTTLTVSAGRLGDLIGRRQLLLAGIALFTLASLLCALAPSLWLLIAARAVQGLGAASMMSLAMALVGETIPKERTGSAMGMLGTLSAIGTALGPSLGGLLIAQFGWQAIFLVNVPLGMLALALVQRFVPADRPCEAAKRPRFDPPGTLLLVLTLAAYALAMTLGHGSFGGANLALLVVAGAGGFLFVRVEAGAASPLVRLALLRNPVLSAGLAMSALVSTVVMTTLVVGPFYLSGALALDAAQVGLVMASGPLVAALTGVPAGRSVDRFGSHKMTCVGLGAMVVGVVMMTLLPVELGALGYCTPLVITTAGYGVFQAGNNTAVMTTLPAAHRGVGAGLLGLSRNLGLITGASVMGILFALGAGETNIASAQAGAVEAGMRITFTVASSLVVTALAIAVASRVISLRAPDPFRSHD